MFRGPGVGHYCCAAAGQLLLTCNCSCWRAAAAPCQLQDGLHTLEQVEHSPPHIATPSFGWQMTARVSHAICPRPRQLSLRPLTLPQLIQPTCVFKLSFSMVCTRTLTKCHLRDSSRMSASLSLTCGQARGWGCGPGDSP